MPGETGRVRYGEEVIRYRIRRPATRRSARVAIHVDADGRVFVDAPEVATDAQVMRAVSRRTGWIFEHVSASLLRRAHVLPRDYVSGESLLYLGRRYRLKVVVAASEGMVVRMSGAHIEVHVRERDPVEVRNALEQWYREKARNVFSERLLTIAATLHWLGESRQCASRS